MDGEQEETPPPSKPSAQDAVDFYRLNTLINAGYPVRIAEQLAVSDADLHVAVQLLERGCPPGLAGRILL